MKLKKEVQEEKKIDEILNASDMKVKPSTGNYVTTGLVLLAMVVVGGFCIAYDSLICGIGLIIIAFYILIISPIGQKTSDYKFEFSDKGGLDGFVLIYRGKKVKLNYKLDKYGKFMWGDQRKKPECISYEDESKMDLYLTKYRILNYVNMYMEQNGLAARNVW